MSRVPNVDYSTIRPKVLKSKDVAGVASYIASTECRNVFLMIGAGVSTSAGIPDFRSPKTGLYANLERLKLPHPEAVFEIGFFRRDPKPFYTLAHELYPGKFRPTITHSFMKLLASHQKLATCFTQNIDTLERLAQVPEHKIIEAHGSFASQSCIDCKAKYPDDLMKKHIEDKSIPKCQACKGLVKPDIVFFGESLPPRFLSALPNLAEADLLIIMGTSLTVQPFAMLVDLVPKDCPRVLINMDKVGSIGPRPDDVILLGKCDDTVKQLAQELGWSKELLDAWEKTRHVVEGSEDASDSEKLKSEVDKLAENIATAFTVSDEEVKPPIKTTDEKEEPQKVTALMETGRATKSEKDAEPAEVEKGETDVKEVDVDPTDRSS